MTRNEIAWRAYSAAWAATLVAAAGCVAGLVREAYLMWALYAEVCR